MNYNSLATVAMDYNSPVAMNKWFVSVASVRCHAGLLLNRVTSLGQGPGWTGWVPPSLCWLGPTQPQKNKKEQVETGPGLHSLFWATNVIGKTHPYVLFLYFHPFLFWYLSKWHFFNIRKFKKKLWTFLNLFVGLSYFF